MNYPLRVSRNGQRPYNNEIGFFKVVPPWWFITLLSPWNACIRTHMIRNHKISSIGERRYMGGGGSSVPPKLAKYKGTGWKGGGAFFHNARIGGKVPFSARLLYVLLVPLTSAQSISCKLCLLDKYGWLWGKMRFKNALQWSSTYLHAKKGFYFLPGQAFERWKIQGLTDKTQGQLKAFFYEQTRELVAMVCQCFNRF